MNSTDTRIVTLSNKIASYSKESLSFPKYTDPHKMGDDLRYNISASITDLAIALMPTPLTAEQITGIIDIFNAAHKTNFTIQTFMGKGWLRLINETYVIVSAVDTHLLRLNNPKLFKETVTPDEYRVEINCLLSIYQANKANIKRSLTIRQVNDIIHKHNPGLNADFFVSRKILAVNGQGNFYINDGNNYIDHLKNRVISLAWFKITATGVTMDSFRKFLRFIDFIHRWPDKLADFISYEHIQKISQFSEDLLNSEEDLSDPEKEILNDHLDRESYKQDSFTPLIPKFQFVDQGPYEFFQQLEDFSGYHHDLFSHEESRSTYLLLLRFILQFEHSQEPYHRVKRLLIEHKNPFIKYQLLHVIKNNFPEVLAYFLDDQQLAPLFFQELDDITIKEEWLKTHASYDENFAVANRIKNDLWMEAFDLYVDMACHASQPGDFAKGLLVALTYVSGKVFSFNIHNYQRSSELHKMFRQRYGDVVKILKNARILYSNSYPKPINTPLLSALVLPEMLDLMNNALTFPQQNEFLHIEAATLDAYIEMLRLSDEDFTNDDLYNDENGRLSKLNEQITEKLYKKLVYYFSVREVEVYNYIDDPKKRVVKRGVGDFGLEIIDFALLFLHFQRDGLISKLDDAFRGHLSFNLDSAKYFEHDRAEAHKVAIYLKILLVAYLSINKRKDTSELLNYPIAETLRSLETLITHYALAYNKDDEGQGKHDIFSSSRYYFYSDIYSQSLTVLLNLALNNFPLKEAKTFIDQYFDASEDLSKLFVAVNRIEDKNIKAELSAKIEKVDAAAFVDKVFSITQLESILIEIVNSRTLYKYAAPFLKVIEDHAAKRNVNTPEKRSFLFTMKLLLALKQKDTEGIKNLPLPKNPFNGADNNAKEQARKQFYLGLDQFYNHKNYIEAVRIFTNLSAQYPKNAEYAFYLYQASAFRDLHNDQASDAKTRWDAFKGSLTEQEKPLLNPFSDQGSGIDILYFAWNQDDIKFDQIVNTLTPIFLYQEELITPVYKNYVRRGMPDVAYAYLNNAISYIKDSGEEVAADIEELKDNAVDDKLIEKIRATLSDLRNLPAIKLPLVLPPILNSKRKLGEFILGEVIGGMRIMRKKIKAVESIVKEDHYNDVFLATLRLRLPVYGWEIADQERTGQSGSGKDAGEADIVIKAAGHELALLEALNMKGKNVSNLEKHVLKCVEYSRDLSAYYIVVYYLGKRSDFKDFLDTYKADISAINYTAPWELDKAKGFVDMTDDFENSENMYIGRTHHRTKKELYHVVIDLSKPDKVVKPIKAPKTAKPPKGPKPKNGTSTVAVF
ncbi:hypothetical protein MTO98_15865 [Mucilaginibacter sp. SMC90]|uniref:hypothetical protein n=1 Tax=Mucilaginibacter sp. SMC90 TaxID=2929803 RepID=UPI001FB3B260|nr:hypothetical protein [Mucilaginibacter sp. SMC90]UOE52553.1 hypothetical protein MTO98_15865 [Mucilaginibacter sp. SMC90]